MSQSRDGIQQADEMNFRQLAKASTAMFCVESSFAHNVKAIVSYGGAYALHYHDMFVDSRVTYSV